MIDLSCTCHTGNPPCVYCTTCSECIGCGQVFYDDDQTTICPTCDEKYRLILERHELDCMCRACEAFVSEPTGEEGFAVAIPILIEMENEQ